MAKKDKTGKDSRGGKDSRDDSPDYDIGNALFGEPADGSNGQRKLNTGRSGQYILSQTAMDSQAKGLLPEKLRAGSINADTWGARASSM
jgi:hypothetical protein